MKQYVFVVISLFIFSFSFSQPALQWHNTVSGNFANDKGRHIALDKDGNVFVAGTTEGINTIVDIITIKYSESGDTLWTRKFSGAGNDLDIPNDCKVDNQGNVYITGQSFSNGNDFDIITIKCSPSGNVLWTNIFNGSANGEDIGYALEIDLYGNVYVAGSSYYTNTFQRDGVVIKYNASGAEVWNKKIHEFNGNLEATVLIALNPLNNIVVAQRVETNQGAYRLLELKTSNGDLYTESGFQGKYNVSVTYDPVGGYPNKMVIDDISGDIFVLSSQNFLPYPYSVHAAKFKHASKERYWDSYSYIDVSGPILTGLDLKIDANLNVFVLSDLYASQTSNHQYFLKKYSPTGTSLWTKQYNKTAGVNDIPIALEMEKIASPDIYVTGYSGTGNISTVKYDKDGNQKWVAEYDCGSNGIDVVTDLVLGKNCSLILTGSSNCSGTYEDIKTIKYCTCAPSTPNPISINSGIICAGSPINLSVNAVSGATSYTWTLPQGWSLPDTTNSITVFAGLSGVISVIANNQICSSTAQLKSVTVSPVPLVNLGDDITVSGGSIELNATGSGLTYKWSTGATTPKITVSTSGTYSVTVTNSGGCTATDQIHIELVVATKELFIPQIIISPNPVQDMLYVKCEDCTIEKIEIFSVLGNLIMTKPFSVASQFHELPLHLSSGIYVAKIWDKGNFKSIPFIKL